MTAAGRESEAERMAKHRREFAEATARGISIIALREVRARERQALRQRAPVTVAQHTADLMDGDSPQCGVDFLSFDAPWMMRD